MPTQEQQVYNLIYGRWISNGELAKQIGHRFGSAIHRLRKKGVIIKTKRAHGGLFYYKIDPQENK